MGGGERPLVNALLSNVVVGIGRFSGFGEDAKAGQAKAALSTELRLQGLVAGNFVSADFLKLAGATNCPLPVLVLLRFTCAEPLC